ncbi:MAG: hypothetical protein R2834_03155 [Rhodothermales bacterium]
MLSFIQMLAGVLLALFTLPLLRAIRNFTEKTKFTLLLLLLPLLYVFIALWTGQRVGPEMWGLLLYGNIAVFGYGTSLAVIAAGMIGHAVWDILHETGRIATFVPSWYVFVCIGYDLAMGTYVFGRWRHYVKEKKDEKLRRAREIAL